MLEPFNQVLHNINKYGENNGRLSRSLDILKTKSNREL